MSLPFKRKGKQTKEEDNKVRPTANFPRHCEADEMEMHCGSEKDSGTPSFKIVCKKTKVERNALGSGQRVQQHPNSLPREQSKFPLSYIGMIAQAINSTNEKKLILADIYSYMEHRFYHYLCNKPRWKNTVRHNLSFHKCFVKCECSPKASRSHYWTIHPDFVEQFNRGNYSKMLEVPAFPKYETNQSPWMSQQLGYFNQGELQTPFSAASSAFLYEPFARYETFPAPNVDDFIHYVPTQVNAVSNMQPFATSRRQFSTPCASTKFYPEPVPKSYQYPHHLIPVPWQIQHLQPQSSSKAMRGFHDLFPSCIAAPTQPQNTFNSNG